MENNHSPAQKSFAKGQGKNKGFEAQMKTVFAALYKQPKTMLMVSIETGILRANICRYVAEWRQNKTIAIAKKGICPISKHNAGFYTTNPELVQKIVELSKHIEQCK